MTPRTIAVRKKEKDGEEEKEQQVTPAADGIRVNVALAAVLLKLCSGISLTGVRKKNVSFHNRLLYLESGCEGNNFTKDSYTFWTTSHDFKVILVFLG